MNIWVRQQGLKLMVMSLAALALIIILGVPNEKHITEAQSSAAQCDALVQEAMQEIANACVNIGRNEVCYGNDQISATLKDDSLFFEARGDIVPVDAIEAIITRPADPESGEWGVALMDIQADLPADSDGSVRIVLLGGVNVAPALEEPVEELPTCQFTNSANDNLNMRIGPGTNFRVVDILDRDATLDVYGQDASGEWLRSSRGWVFAELGDLTCAGEDLTVMESTQDAYVAPMQSFTLQVDEAAECQTAPAGLLIQSPEGQTANIMVNNVELRIGSTAFVTMSGDNSQMSVANLDGNVSMSADGGTTRIPTGAQANVGIEGGQSSGTPTGIRPFSNTVSNLSNDITNALPETLDVPNTLVFEQPQPGSSGGSGNTGSDSGNPPPGQWLGCGSCDSCGHPGNECVTSPTGQCVWDPGTCAAPPETPIVTPDPPVLTVPDSLYFCGPEETFQVSATYSSSDGAVIEEASADSSDAFAVQISDLVTTSPTTYNIILFCNGQGTSTITTGVLDSEGRQLQTSFDVLVEFGSY